MEVTNEIIKASEEAIIEDKKFDISKLTFLCKLNKEIPWETTNRKKSIDKKTAPSKLFTKFTLFNQKKEKSDEHKKIELEKRRKDFLSRQL
jgi:hypothetical protein